MTLKFNIKYLLLSLGWLFFFTLSSHLPFLLNDGVFWDAWVYTSLIDRGDFSSFFLPWDQNGRPLLGYIYWFIGYNFGAIFGFKFFSLLSIFISSVLILFLFQRFFWMDRGISLTASTFIICYHSYSVHLSFTTIVFSLFLPFFLMGIYFALLQYELVGIKKWAVRITSYIFLAISMIAEAPVTMAYIILIVVLVKQNCFSEGNYLKIIIRTISKNLDYCLLPIIYFICMKIFMPVSGDYDGARSISLGVSNFKSLIRFFGTFIDFNFLYPFDTFSRHVNARIFIVFTVVAIYLLKKKGKLHYSDKNILSLLFIGFALLVLTAIPFALGNRAVDLRGWSARHLVLQSIPASIFLIVYLETFWGEERKKGIKRWVVAIMIVLMTMSLWQNYLVWQGRWAVDSSIIENMKGDKEVKETSVFFVNTKYVPAHNEVYRSYEWMGMMNRAFGDFSRLVLADDKIEFEKKLTEGIQWAKNSGILRKFNPKGCVLELNVKLNYEYNQPDGKLGLRYLYYRYFTNKNNFMNWLKSLTTLNNKSRRNC